MIDQGWNPQKPLCHRYPKLMRMIFMIVIQCIAMHCNVLWWFGYEVRAKGQLIGFKDFKSPQIRAIDDSVFIIQKKTFMVFQANNHEITC